MTLKYNKIPICKIDTIIITLYWCEHYAEPYRIYQYNSLKVVLIPTTTQRDSWNRDVCCGGEILVAEITEELIAVDGKKMSSLPEQMI